MLVSCSLCCVRVVVLRSLPHVALPAPQIKFYEVSQAELETQRAAFAAGQLPLEAEGAPFDMAAYNSFVAEVEPEAAAFRAKQQVAAAEQVCFMTIAGFWQLCCCQSLCHTLHRNM